MTSKLRIVHKRKHNSNFLSDSMGSESFARSWYFLTLPRNFPLLWNRKFIHYVQNSPPLYPTRASWIQSKVLHRIPIRPNWKHFQIHKITPYSVLQKYQNFERIYSLCHRMSEHNAEMFIPFYRSAPYRIAGEQILSTLFRQTKCSKILLDYLETKNLERRPSEKWLNMKERVYRKIWECTNRVQTRNSGRYLDKAKRKWFNRMKYL